MKILSDDENYSNEEDDNHQYKIESIENLDTVLKELKEECSLSNL